MEDIMSAAAPVIRRVAVVGTGVIGASWAAFFLARGLDVTATDPAPGAEQRLREAVQRHWPTMQRMGLVDGASLERLRFDAELERALDGCDFVQGYLLSRPVPLHEIQPILDQLNQPQALTPASRVRDTSGPGSTGPFADTPDLHAGASTARPGR